MSRESELASWIEQVAAIPDPLQRARAGLALERELLDALPKVRDSIGAAIRAQREQTGESERAVAKQVPMNVMTANRLARRRQRD